MPNDDEFAYRTSVEGEEIFPRDRSRLTATIKACEKALLTMQRIENQRRKIVAMIISIQRKEHANLASERIVSMIKPLITNESNIQPDLDWRGTGKPCQGIVLNTGEWPSIRHIVCLSKARCIMALFYYALRLWEPENPALKEHLKSRLELDIEAMYQETGDPGWARCFLQPVLDAVKQ